MQAISIDIYIMPNSFDSYRVMTKFKWRMQSNYGTKNQQADWPNKLNTPSERPVMTPIFIRLNNTTDGTELHRAWAHHRRVGVHSTNIHILYMYPLLRGIADIHTPRHPTVHGHYPILFIRICGVSVCYSKSGRYTNTLRKYITNWISRARSMK